MQSYYRRSHRFPVVAFLDIKSAYDTVDRRVIWDALSRSGASSPFLSLLVHLFDDVSVSVLVSNHSSAPFSPVTGVLQGSVLSPHLYSVYINTLPALLRQIAAPATHLVPSSGRSDAGMVPSKRCSNYVNNTPCLWVIDGTQQNVRCVVFGH
ncbi:hypothetical protein G6F62_014140 [Rhizopus arrhizus]|nr:hypothetical protein G6F24_016001 [Rhizopus arrhizus]KAG0775653.1 hypothetical protein G6F21_013864 [Rhizopus arrhizus]KAG0807151.1 hypothetical protein G6F19_013864 [Rhizopus arrhizus]KAG0857215.1 hypothetical protein G6F15_013888 [Rhizopus arrhizus]KAG0926125.1 hypothetical protein G6F31_018499 [Rhizopus arrhizus]